MGIVLLVLWRHHTAPYPEAEFSIIIRSTRSFNLDRLLSEPSFRAVQFDTWPSTFDEVNKREKNKFLRIFALALFIVQSIIDICYKGQLRSYQMSHLEWLITLGKSRPVWPEAFLHSCPYLSFHNVENHTRPTSSETEQRFYYVVMTSFYIIT